MASVLALWVFFIQKIGLLVNVNVSWPPWFLDVLNVSAFFTLDVPSISVNISDGVWNSCLAAVKLLFAFMVLARTGALLHHQQPAHGLRAVASDAAVPALAFAIFILAKLASGLGVFLGLAVALCCPVIAYIIILHLFRGLLWKVGTYTHGGSHEDARVEYYETAYRAEMFSLIFLYFSAYLTDIGALLDRMDPERPVALRALCGVLLVFLLARADLNSMEGGPRHATRVGYHCCESG